MLHDELRCQSRSRGHGHENQPHRHARQPAPTMPLWPASLPPLVRPIIVARPVQAHHHIALPERLSAERSVTEIRTADRAAKYKRQCMKVSPDTRWDHAPFALCCRICRRTGLRAVFHYAMLPPGCKRGGDCEAICFNDFNASWTGGVRHAARQDRGRSECRPLHAGGQRAFGYRNKSAKQGCDRGRIGRFSHRRAGFLDVGRRPRNRDRNSQRAMRRAKNLISVASALGEPLAFIGLTGDSLDDGFGKGFALVNGLWAVEQQNGFLAR
ncbi:hypothetical protein MESS2_740070 [Mesorhizobium metallidurans STM 2683]|uniref:Uncharacterized protein n=1 Tax=Mesorhizobium metallidurans STM 2683 TaxID=1297569 RepID=M5EWX5_9HYPH|nr:hypothetical protein MESS2_740070 [Mesorhizobium metallidurans STM 2683]